MPIANSDLEIIQYLDALIAERLSNPRTYPESSTVLLAGKGLMGMAVKVGEETSELIQAVIIEDDEAVLNEAQQLLYMTAVGIVLSGTAGGLAASLELAKCQPGRPIGNCNEVVKDLGRSAARFSFALGANMSILESGSVLVNSVDTTVRFRGLFLDQVIERI